MKRVSTCVGLSSKRHDGMAAVVIEGCAGEPVDMLFANGDLVRVKTSQTLVGLMTGQVVVPSVCYEEKIVGGPGRHKERIAKVMSARRLWGMVDAPASAREALAALDLVLENLAKREKEQADGMCNSETGEAAIA